MEDLHLIDPDLPVIILTGYGSIENAVNAMKKGAFNYLTKPFDKRELLLQLESALKTRALTAQIKRLKEFCAEKYDFKNIVVHSDKMRKVLDEVALIAKTDSTVCILGESGTGKELIARAIHAASERNEKEFTAINCAAIPETLLESELFGYEKGAFTGAVKSSKGLFSRADKGTVFLDEIGDTPLSIQTKLLRILQEQEFYPVGGRDPVRVDVRILVATNKDLQNEVKEGRFRNDLFFRVHVVPIYLPPLRERKEELPALAAHFLEKYSAATEKMVKRFSPTAMRKLMLYDWPGNIRELENVIECAVVLTNKDVITEEFVLFSRLGEEPSGQLESYKKAKETFERNYISRAMELSNGNISKAAELAGKHRTDVYYLLKKYNLSPEDFREI